MSVSQYSVEVEGLKPLLHSFAKLDIEMRKGITDALRVLARDVQMKAKQIAADEGFTAPGTSGRGTGALVKDIRYSVTQRGAFIRETALNSSGFRYPAVYEYGNSKWGSRPFLEPALKEEEPHIIEGVELMMDHVLYGF